MDDINREYLLQLPIRTINFSNPVDKKLHDNIVASVDSILAIPKDEDYLLNPVKQEQVKSLEQEIDQLVYKLYGLTEEEIKTVEGK